MLRTAHKKVKLPLLKEIGRRKFGREVQTSIKVMERSGMEAQQEVRELESSLEGTRFKAKTRSGQNELQFLVAINDALANKLASETHKETYSVSGTVISPHGENHLGIFYDQVLKDFQARYQVLQGKRVINYIGVNCLGEELEKSAEDFQTNLVKTEIIERQENGELDPQVERVDPQAFLGNYIRDRTRSHLNDLYRWGVMMDRKNIFLTNQPQYLKTVYEVLSDLAPRIGVDYTPKFYTFGGSAGSARQVPANNLALEDNNNERYFISVEMDSYQDSKFDLFLSLYPRMKMVVYLDEPWKMAGVQGLTLSPHSSYIIFVHSQQFYCMSENSFNSFGQNLLFKEGRYPKKLKTVFFEEMEGLFFTNPLKLSQKLPLVANPTLDSEMCPTEIELYCPAIEARDFGLGTTITFDKRPVIDMEGKIVHSNPKLDGAYVVNDIANEAALLALTQAESIFEYKTTSVKYKIIDNISKKGVFLVPEVQWRLKPDTKMAARMSKELEMIEDTTDIDRSKADLIDETIKVSQIFNTQNLPTLELCGEQKYGPPLPIFRFKEESNRYLISKSVIKHVGDLIQQNGPGIWQSFPVEELLPKKYKNIADQLEKVDLKLSAKFMTGCSSIFAKEQLGGEGYPFDFMIQGADQVSKSLYDSMAINMTYLGIIPPTKRIHTHDMIHMDEDQQKIRKNDDQVASVNAILEGILKGSEQQHYSHGVEHLRLWAASRHTRTFNNPFIPLEADDLASKIAELNLIRDSMGLMASFEQKYRKELGDARLIPIQGLLNPFEQILLDSFALLESFVDKSYEDNDTREVYSLMLDFVKFHYLDFIYPYLRNREDLQTQNPQGLKIAYYLNSKLLNLTTKSWAPILPFSCEEVWLRARGKSFFGSSTIDNLDQQEEDLNLQNSENNLEDENIQEQKNAQEIRNNQLTENYNNFLDIFEIFTKVEKTKNELRSLKRNIKSPKEFSVFITYGSEDRNTPVRKLLVSIQDLLPQILNVAHCEYSSEDEFTAKVQYTRASKTFRFNKLRFWFYEHNENYMIPVYRGEQDIYLGRPAQELEQLESFQDSREGVINY